MIINIRNSKSKDKILIRIKNSLEEEFRSRIMPNFISISDAYNGYGNVAFYISLDDLGRLILDREFHNIEITVGDDR